MFKHIFKLTWNKRRQNFLFLSEILVSFMVIFAVSSLLVFYYLNYMKPQGMNTNRVWVVSYGGDLGKKPVDSAQLIIELVSRTLRALPEIEDLSFTHANYPYSGNTSTTSMAHNGKHVNPVNFFNVEGSYATVMGMKVLEGRWFNEEDGKVDNKNLVISASLKKAIFGDAPAVGEKIGEDPKELLHVIGVVQDVKNEGDYWSSGPGMYRLLDTSTYRGAGIIFLKVSPDADAAFESRLHKLLGRTIENANLDIQHLDEVRDAKNEEALIPVIICMTIAGFLIVNVALGLFGVLWYNINQRRSEIGLRRAIGASGHSVSLQLVYESIMLTSLSILLGTFFAVQFPLLNVFGVSASVYLIALGLTIVFIYLLVILCSIYPGRQAAAIHPAIALHEE
jgi:putative ABC transport system permease protein